MNLEEIKAYLLGDLTNSIVNDVRPCLNPNISERGYFAVPRLVLSYIAYLGKLYRAGHKKFINKVLGAVDSNYRKHGMLFWEIYRNGFTDISLWCSNMCSYEGNLFRLFSLGIF